MDPRSWKSSLPRRAAAVGVFAVFVPAAGCTAIFGFERPDLLVECIHQSDCPTGVCLSNVCTTGCLTDEDCSGPPAYLDGLVCRANACVAEDAGAKVSPGDGGIDANGVNSEASACGNTTDNVDNCGSCGNACVGKHARWGCAASTCIVLACDPGWGDCNGSASDGCELLVATDAGVCGGCASTCPSTVCDDMNVCAQSLCSSGVCRPLAIPGLLATRGTQSEQLNPSILYAFQVPTSPGSLTAFGIISDSVSGLDEAGVPTVLDSHAYLGLYTDVDGQPGQLKATAAGGQALSIAGGTSQIFSVSPPV
jgi:hypothetical protein